MKSVKMFMFGLVLMFALSLNVKAADIFDYSSLKACLETSDSICKLGANVELDAHIEISEEVTLDLNGYNITPSSTFNSGDSLFIVLHGGTLTVEDSSSGKNGEISTGNNENIFVGIKMTKAGCNTDDAATLIVNSGTIEGYNYGISGNGNPDRINTIININGGTVKGLSNESSTGIYHPQDGILYVTGGLVTGRTGIEMRAGTLAVEGGEIVGTGVPVKVSANGNGTTTDGAGIAISQHTTKKDIAVAITGGTVKGYSAIYESNPQNNSESDISKVEIGIIGGNFEAINGGNVTVYSENLEEFIAGGNFDKTIDEDYLTSESKLEEENGSFVAKTLVEVRILDVTNNKVIEVKEVYSGDLVKLDIKADKGYEIDTISVVDIMVGEEIKLTDNSFTMPVYPVEVQVTFKEAIVNPATGDNIIMFGALAVVSLVVGLLSLNKLKYNN